MRGMRRLLGRSLVWGVVLLQLPKNLEFHLKRLQGSRGKHTMRSQLVSRPRRWEAYGKLTSWLASLKSWGCGWILNTANRRLVSAAVFRKTKGTQHSPVFKETMWPQAVEWGISFVFFLRHPFLSSADFLALRLVFGVLQAWSVGHCGLSLAQENVWGKLEQGPVWDWVGGWVRTSPAQLIVWEALVQGSHYSKCGPGDLLDIWTLRFHPRIWRLHLQHWPRWCTFLSHLSILITPRNPLCQGLPSGVALDGSSVRE